MIRIFGPAKTNGLRRSRRVLKNPQLRTEFAQRLADKVAQGKTNESLILIDRTMKRLSIKNARDFVLDFGNAMAQHMIERLNKSIQKVEKTRQTI